MKKEYHNIIIGAGPGGLFAAIQLGKNSDTLILEKNRTSGKKLLMSGSGRCNITQSGQISNFFSRYGNKRNFISPSLKEFSNNDLIDFLHQNGLKTINIKGKVFPASQDAKDVLNIFLAICRKNNVQIKNSVDVESISQENGQFIVRSRSQIYKCKNLIIATGGKSYPSTGSTGDGYDFAEALGHTIINPKPALTPVYIKDYIFSEISGYALPKRKVHIYRNNKKIAENVGDIGFTHKGLSGPGIIDASRFIKPHDVLIVNLIDRNENELRDELIHSSSENGKMSIKKFLKTYDLSDLLIKITLKEIDIDPQTKLAEISKKIRNAIIKVFCNYQFIIKSSGDFNIAMVTAGGVSVSEVSPKTMESKIIDNLYFVGEVLDIDGDTGGYNLQAAFSTAFLAAKHIRSKNKINY